MDRKRVLALLLALLMLPLSATAQMVTASTLTADADVTTVEMSDTLYGLFFEDINYAADGGIYAELLTLTASASAADRKRLKQFGLEV